jgi:hypothetical protein
MFYIIKGLISNTEILRYKNTELSNNSWTKDFVAGIQYELQLQNRVWLIPESQSHRTGSHWFLTA